MTLYRSQGNSLIKRKTSTKVSHALVKIPPTENKKRPQKRCFICWTRYHKRKDVRTHCAGCEKKAWSLWRRTLEKIPFKKALDAYIKFMSFSKTIIFYSYIEKDTWKNMIVFSFIIEKSL